MVDCQPVLYERRKGGDIGSQAKVLRSKVWSSNSAISGTGGVDDDHVGEVEPCFVVVNCLERRIRQSAVVVHRRALRTKCTHVEPKRGASWTSVESESHWPRMRRSALL